MNGKGPGRPPRDTQLNVSNFFKPSNRTASHKGSDEQQAERRTQSRWLQRTGQQRQSGMQQQQQRRGHLQADLRHQQQGGALGGSSNVSGCLPCTCTCTRAHACTYTCTRAHACTCEHASMLMHARTHWAYTHTRTCLCLRTYAHTCTCGHTSMLTCVQACARAAQRAKRPRIGSHCVY